MSHEERQSLKDIQVDCGNLYHEDMFTDLKVATIRRFTPVKPDGSIDDTRPVLFTGETQIMSQMGALPVQCPIEAGDLQAAMEKFPEAVRRAVERMVEEARELQRQEASRIVTPGKDFPGSTLQLP